MGLIESIDFHQHTNASLCGSDRIEDLLRAARERGFTHIGLTDHYYKAPKDPARAGAAPFLRTREKLASLAPDISVAVSSEVCVKDKSGELDVANLDELKNALDYISGAHHCQGYEMPEGASPLDYYHEMVLNMCRNPDIAVILHPWDAPSAMLRSLADLPAGYLREFAEAAAAGGKIVEISNCFTHLGVWRDAAGMTASYHLLVEELRRAGAKMVVGSDGHSLAPRQVGPDRRQEAPTSLETSWAAATLRQCGVTDEGIRMPPRRGNA